MHLIHIVCLLKENSQQQLRSAILAQWIAVLLSSERALDWSLVMAGFQFVFLFFHFCSYRKLLLIVKIHSKPKAVYKHFVQHIKISVWRMINTIVFIWQKTCSNIYTHMHYLFFGVHSFLKENYSLLGTYPGKFLHHFVKTLWSPRVTSI